MCNTAHNEAQWCYTVFVAASNVTKRGYMQTLENAQLQMLQSMDKRGREAIAAIALIMYDLDTAKLLLQHWREELGAKVCNWLQEMLDFEQKLLLEEAQALQQVH
jgi:hypothetical protein